MRFAEHLGDLDPELAGKLEQAVQAVRDEFEDKLTAAIRTVVREAAERSAAQAAAMPPPVAAAAPARPTLALDAADELRMAALDIDVATSQAQILEALTRGLLRFASRVAIFVNRGDEVHGWNCSGFGAADATIKTVVMARARLSPPGTDRDSGSLALSAADCAVICDALGAERPAIGLLMPFVLGRQVVGTVYCDRLGDHSFSVSALQLLTYIAGQTLETLPVRKRSSTATLNLAPAAPAATAEPVPDLEAAPPEEPDVEPAVEPAVGLVEPHPEPEVSAPSDFEVQSSAIVELPAPAIAIPESALPRRFSSLIQESRPPAAPIAEEAEEEEEEEPTRPGYLAAEPAAAIKTAPPPVPSPPSFDLSSTEVVPPKDLEGPGWAFTTATAAAEASSDAEHEDAQRLARLLVTEIKLYNEEAVEEGRRNSNVYSRLRDDIDRSRQIFEDRIAESVRTDNDYFNQALVRILAGGDPSLLGI